MARRKSAAELQALATTKKEQEAARKAARSANPAPYKGRPETDYQYAYYVDPFNNARALRFRVPNDSLTLFGGLAKAGLVATLPSGKAEVNIAKGNKLNIIRIRWYFGNATPTVVPETQTHGRWLRFADKTSGKYIHTLPFGASAGDNLDATPGLDTIILRFEAALNTSGEITRLLGAKGRAVLEQGYGSRFVTLSTVNA